MSPTTLSLLAIGVSALGNVAQFGLWMLHGRRDKREFSKRPITEVQR